MFDRIRVTYLTNCASCIETVNVQGLLVQILAELALGLFFWACITFTRGLFVFFGCLSFHHFADDVQNNQVGFLPGVHRLQIHDLIAELLDQQIDDDKTQIFKMRKIDLATYVVFGQLLDHLLKNLWFLHRINDAGQSVEHVVGMGRYTRVTAKSDRKKKKAIKNET